MKKPIVAIIGRVNVGKSTLFNRIIKKKTAIVENEPGITRDRIYAECEWKGHPFILVDTGGVDFIKKEDIQKKIDVQIELAIEEADLIILLVDIKEGINPDDFKVAKTIREKEKPSILVANKGDVRGSELKLYEFYELGFGDPYIISAEHGLNIDDLLDGIVSNLTKVELEPEEEEGNIIKVSIIGKPNVGKSSLLNYILGEDRIIVSEYPGTTRDAIEINFKHDSLKLLFIDTAGLRDKAKAKEDIEYYSTLRTFKAIQNSDISLLILDSTQGVSVQDKK
ncbi:MAG TPA: ribosome biogenesis GTPase Der, partial [Atribacterota bacterium]|nr:ribosome biogenesis GTPase Der [Atribacterota bacterium]